MLQSTSAPAADAAPRDRLVQSDLACILVHALNEREAKGGTLPDHLGLAPAQLEDLAQTWFSGLTLPDTDPAEPTRHPDQEAVAMLLLWRGGNKSPEAHWLAAIIARRALEKRHLWEDLGLPSRDALGTLLALHFPRLFAANTRNMRWKKFFYRQICSDSEFALCLSPSCDECPEKPECFAPDPSDPDPSTDAVIAAQ